MSNMCSLRVLGVDPGLTRCGIGVVEGRAGDPLSAVGYDVIRTSTDDHVAHRLLALDEAIAAAIVHYRPDVVAVERVFSQNNVSTVMGTAQASGVALVAAARARLPVTLHTPSEVKAAVTGNGRADKAQVTAMVTRVLRLSEAPRPADAADALALAICHVWRGTSVGRLSAAAAQAGPSLAERVASGKTSGLPTAAEPIRSRIPQTPARSRDRRPSARSPRTDRKPS